jgi:hypothetical protein
MGVMLNRHPRIACGPEGKLLKRTSFRAFHRHLEETWIPTKLHKYDFGVPALDRAMAAFVDNFFTRYQLRQGKQRWAEKTPGNIDHIDYLFRLFPHAQFIHMIRDPRDVYCSVVEKMCNDPRFDALTVEQTAQRWVEGIEKGLTWRAKRARYLEVRYEELVHEPVATMREVLQFLGEPWDDGVFNPEHDAHRASATSNTHRPIFSTSVGRWRRELSAEDLRQIEAIAGGLMRQIGYEPSTQPTRPASAMTAAISDE